MAKWLVGFLVGLVWANAFEYAYHRFLLHLPGNFFARKHLTHHMTVGTPSEAEHVNLGGSPIWVAVLFVINGLPAIASDMLLRIGIAPGMLVGFVVYVIVVEEFHWRIHLNETLPMPFRFAREYHYAHHTYPNARFNIFLPLWDALFGSLGAQEHQSPGHHLADQWGAALNPDKLLAARVSGRFKTSWSAASPASHGSCPDRARSN